jgi:hypothetical protein
MIRNLGLKSLFATGLIVVFFAALPASAQSSASTATVSSDLAALTPVYDITREVKIQGNVLKIETAGGGALIGTHIQIQSPQGVVDTHLGSSAAISPKALGLFVGQSVTVTGMMATVGGNSVLLARVLTTSNHVFNLRNEHGIPARSLMPRGGSSSSNAVKGGL